MQMALSITAIIVAVMFPLFFLLRKESASLPAQLTVAIVVTAILELFELLTFCYPEQLYFWKKFSITAEALVIPAWLWFSLTYARQEGQLINSMSHRLLLATSPLFVLIALIMPIRSMLYSPDFVMEKILFLTNYGFIFYIMMLAYLVAALIQLEQTFAQTTRTSRWKIKFELLGAGAFLTMLTLYYSQSLLFRTINMGMVPMRSVILIVAITMMFYSRLKRGSGTVSVHVSPQIACKSAVLLAVGTYIILLGLVGEGMKYFGDGFQRSLIFTLVFFTGLILAIILLSETVKRRITVFIHNNFYQNKYDYRKQWIQFTDRLSACHTNEKLLQSIVSEFCDTFGMGTGALFTINEERNLYRQAACIGLDGNEISFNISDPTIESLAGKKWIMDLRNNIGEPEDNRHNAFFAEADACFIIPLFMNEAVDGFLILGRPHSHEELYTHEDFDLMRTLARQASSALLNLQLADQLSCSRELAAIGKISAFVMHDLKNLICAVSLMLENAHEYIGVPEFQSDMLVSLENIVARMNSLILRLKDLPEKNSLELTHFDLLEMARETAAMVNGTALNVTGEHVIAEGDREELLKVTLNLMLNAVESTDGTTPVNVEVGENGCPFIRVKDEGCGIPEVFQRNVLFKPFTSTKKEGLGIGLYQSRQIIEAHGGRIDVVSSIDQGSEFTVWLPKIPSIAA